MYSFGPPIAARRRQKTDVTGTRRVGRTGLRVVPPASGLDEVVQESQAQASVIGGGLDELDEDPAGILGMDEVVPRIRGAAARSVVNETDAVGT